MRWFDRMKEIPDSIEPCRDITRTRLPSDPLVVSQGYLEKTIDLLSRWTTRKKRFRPWFSPSCPLSRLLSLIVILINQTKYYITSRTHRLFNTSANSLPDRIWSIRYVPRMNSSWLKLPRVDLSTKRLCIKVIKIKKAINIPYLSKSSVVQSATNPDPVNDRSREWPRFERIQWRI